MVRPGKGAGWEGERLWITDLSIAALDVCRRDNFPVASILEFEDSREGGGRAGRGEAGCRRKETWGNYGEGRPHILK